MIVVPRSELRKFTSEGAKFAKSVGGNGRHLFLSPDDYATLQTHRNPPQSEWIGTNEVKIKTCGLAKRFAPEALQLFHTDAIANGTADKNPLTVRRATWDAAQKYRLNPSNNPKEKQHASE